MSTVHLSAARALDDDRGTTIAATLSAVDDTGEALDLHLGFPPGWQIDRTVTPFVPLATLIAAWFGHDLVVDAPVRTEVLQSARAILPRFAQLAQHLPITVTAEEVASPRRPPGRSTALFLSRGVDSSRNLVLADQGRLEPRPDLAVIVKGIEPFRTDDDAASAVRVAERVAARFGLRSVVVTTNIFDVVARHVTFPHVHGGALLGIGHALAHHLEHLITSSASGWRTSVPAKDAPPWWSDASLDAGWGNQDLTLHVLPETTSRSDRVEEIARDGRALDWLRVCWREPTYNCGQCRKCIATAALLDVFGALGRAATFRRGTVWAEDVRREPPGMEFVHDFIARVESTRPDLANAARLSQDRLHDPFRWLPELVRLRSCQLQPGTDGRTISWCALGPVDAQVIERAHRAMGPGLVWGGAAPLPRPVLERVLTASAVALWSGPDDVVDVERVLLALEHGARPVQVVDDAAIVPLRAALPPALEPLVCSRHELAEVVAVDVAELGRVFASGGAGWLRDTA